MPISRAVLPHTGRLDGDDTGYRQVRVSELDRTDPDPLVPMTSDILVHPVYAAGSAYRITPMYSRGLGAPATPLIRAPALESLREANRSLVRYGRALIVFDAWRPAYVQARLWSYIFDLRVAQAGASPAELTVREWIEFGRMADDTASFCHARPGASFAKGIEDLHVGSRRDQLDQAAEALKMTPDSVAAECMTFMANYGLADIELDATANTAHGSGGACDVGLVDLASRSPTNLGVPFDSTSTAAVMDYFEYATPESYAELLRKDPVLRLHQSDFGNTATDVGDHFEDIRRERRILFHAMREAGATFFSLGHDMGESWHFNFGNEREGRQAAIHLGAGNGCHSLLRDVRDDSGRWVAVWGNEAAHQMAARLLGHPRAYGPPRPS